MNFIEEVTGYKLYYYQMITIPASISSTVKKKSTVELGRSSLAALYPPRAAEIPRSALHLLSVGVERSWRKATRLSFSEIAYYISIGTDCINYRATSGFRQLNYSSLFKVIIMGWMAFMFCASLALSALLNVEAKLNLFLNQREVRRLLGKFH